MKEYKGIVTIEGGPLTLTGSKVEVGQQAPDFEVLNSELSLVKLSALKVWKHSRTIGMCLSARPLAY